MLNTSFLPFPVLQTNRLLLRCHHENDASELFEIRKSEVAMRYIPRPRAQNLADIEALITLFNESAKEGNAINWAICTHEKPRQVIGMIGFVSFCHKRGVAEIGYMLNPKFWGKGYIMEAIKEVEYYGFNEIKLNAIEAKIDPRNENSKKILLRNNYSFVKFAQKELEFEGKEHDTEYYIKYK